MSAAMSALRRIKAMIRHNEDEARLLRGRGREEGARVYDNLATGNRQAHDLLEEEMREAGEEVEDV